MECREFRQHWTDWREGWLDTDGSAMAAHRQTCRHCARYDRQMAGLVDSLGNLPMPDTPPRTANRIRRRPPGWAPWAAAVAAALVLGLSLGVTLTSRFGGPDAAPMVANPVRLIGSGNREIAVAVTSPRALSEVTFVVELPAGVELSGFPDQRTVRWTGRLAEGRSRLRLPLRVEADAPGGDVVTRIQVNGTERRLIVPLDMGPDSNAASSSTNRT